MTTIYDVAHAADVSPKTVSRVINREPHVAEEVRERVLQAIADLDFRPNFNARQMRTRKSEAIAFIADDISITHYSTDLITDLIRGAFKTAWDHHKLLLIVNTERDPEIKERSVELMLERQIEGIIYAAGHHRPVTPPVNVHKLPTVLLDCFVIDRSLPSIVPDEEQGGYTATHALLEKGHRRIGFMNDAYPLLAAFGRLEGYKKALAEFSIPFDPELVISRQPPEPSAGEDAAHEFLALPCPPTALFCFNDRMASGAYRAIHDAHLVIPDDIAVIGFDNQKSLAESLDPPLTTIELPYYEMGHWAVEQLVRLLNHPGGIDGHSPIQAKADCPLVERASI